MKAIARWTIGDTNPDGYECLFLSISSFLKHYDVEVVICHNCEESKLPSKTKQFRLINQKNIKVDGPVPIGVAWKLYPPRIDKNRHEICIDNDLVLNAQIDKISAFLESDSTLLLEDKGRTYGRFEKHVPANFCINSGIYGMPPQFDLDSYVKFYSGTSWQKNAFNQHDKNETFDEQGLVALALLNHKRYFIIEKETITNCEYHLIEGKGYHFIGLNRRVHHAPYRLYRSLKKKLYL